MQATAEQTNDSVHEVERHTDDVHTASFSSLISGWDILAGQCRLSANRFSPYAPFGNVKSCGVQRKMQVSIPYRHLHGFIPFMQKQHHIYKNKILWTRKHTDSCARQELHRYRSFFRERHCNGCAEQRRMMTAGKPATSYCLATCWREWYPQPESARASADLLHFPQVRRSIPRNSFQTGGTWAGSAYATCWLHLRIWGLSTLAVQGWLPS